MACAFHPKASSLHTCDNMVGSTLWQPKKIPFALTAMTASQFDGSTSCVLMPAIGVFAMVSAVELDRRPTLGASQASKLKFGHERFALLRFHATEATHRRCKWNGQRH